MPERAPDVTETEFGRQMVEIMARGIIAIMEAQNIPFDEKGFEEVVRLAMEMNLQGRIAFLDPTASALAGEVLSRKFALIDPQLFTAQTRSGSTRMRQWLEQHGLTPESTLLSEEERQRKLTAIKRLVGDAFGFVEAVRHGDCQRRLVFARVREILAGRNKLNEDLISSELVQ